MQDNSLATIDQETPPVKIHPPPPPHVPELIFLTAVGTVFALDVIHISIAFIFTAWVGDVRSPALS